LDNPAEGQVLNQLPGSGIQHTLVPERIAIPYIPKLLS
jgi:hypothetical protein